MQFIIYSAGKVVSLEDAVYFIMQTILSQGVVLRKLRKSECNRFDYVDVQDVGNKISVLCITRRKNICVHKYNKM